MAAFLYGLGRDLILTQGVNVVTAALSGTLVATTGGSIGTTNYNPVTQSTQNTDRFFSIIPGQAADGTGCIFNGGGSFATPISFGARTTSLGSLFVSGNQLVFTAVLSPSGAQAGLAAGALVLWVRLGTAAASPLIAYIDSASWNPANPVTPNGSAITFTFQSVAPGIFTL